MPRDYSVRTNHSIRECFDYFDGILYWRKFPNNHYSTNYKIGDPVGKLNAHGYLTICFNGKQSSIHNLIWEGFYGPIPKGMIIDHIDRNRSNNRIENLRLCTRSQNAWNTSLLPTNKTGIKGLLWDEKQKTWIGLIAANGKTYRKQSKKREIIEAWLIEKRNEVHGEFATHQ